MTDQPAHLWEIDHPYYAAEGNYFKEGQHTRWNSWESFRDETAFVSGDRDLNLLYRWDWRKPGHHDWDGPETLLLFFVIQRKGFNCSHEVTVTEADEPAIRAWLEECAQTIRAIWEPVSLTPAALDRQQ